MTIQKKCKTMHHQIYNGHRHTLGVFSNRHQLATVMCVSSSSKTFNAGIMDVKTSPSLLVASERYCEAELKYHYTECALQHMIHFEPVLNLKSEVFMAEAAVWPHGVSQNEWCLQSSRTFWLMYTKLTRNTSIASIR